MFLLLLTINFDNFYKNFYKNYFFLFDNYIKYFDKIGSVVYYIN